MKNHFVFSYAGNKRKEVEEIYKNINFNNITTILEPFCGSCSLSYYIWTLNKVVMNFINQILMKILQIYMNIYIIAN